MGCSIDECFEQISAYCSGEKTGHVLLVNTESNDIYKKLLNRFCADKGKNCIFVSKNTQPNGLPNCDYIMGMISGDGSYVLVGISQAMMLKSALAVENVIDKLLGLSISGCAIVLLSHCKQYIQRFMAMDIRIKNRVVLVESKVSPLPQIKLAKSKEQCIDLSPKGNIPELLAYLEKMTDEQIAEHPSVAVVTDFSPLLFRDSVYGVSACSGIYDSLCQEYVGLSGATEKGFGTDEQWMWLASELKKEKILSSVTCKMFGSTVNLSSRLMSAHDSRNENEYWMLWLSLKVFGDQNNQYLNRVMQHSNTVDDFEEHIYYDLLDIDCSDDLFSRYYDERKSLIDSLPENLSLIDTYCNRIGRLEKNAIYYLTDSSEREKFELMRCFGIYDYSENEIVKALQRNFPELAKYLHPFTFDQINTQLSGRDALLRDTLTQYFRDYKMQKLTNRIYPEFLQKVKSFAAARPYNRLKPRSSIVSTMDRENAQLFFFDALGVEYLSYIEAKCKEYGLISEISVGHCELPSITSKNKEFLQYFPNDSCLKVDELDELKHHSKVFDFRKRTEPIHLFKELEIIDTTLRQIQSQLVLGSYQKAIIVSDHGASRLAVLYGHENQSMVEMEENGEHSGRCCPVKENLHIPYTAYEDGYAVLADYKRFKGSRKANVEVHGGASLEEAVVPIITLSKRPDKIELCFTHPVIELKMREKARITLFSNVPLQKPRLLVNGRFYEGTFAADNRHALFIMPELKRSKEYSAKVYDGDKNLFTTLSFRIQKKTGREVELF